MQREFRKIGEDYRGQHRGFASIVRSMEEVNQGLRGIVLEMTEYSKRSIGQALEIQAQLARMAFGPYDALIARAEALKDASSPTGWPLPRPQKTNGHVRSRRARAWLPNEKAGW